MRIGTLAAVLCGSSVACATASDVATSTSMLEAEPDVVTSDVVTSIVTYSTRPSLVGSFADPLLYKTTFDELVRANPELSGYCTDASVPVWSGVSSRQTCGGPAGGFAS